MLPVTWHFFPALRSTENHQKSDTATSSPSLLGLTLDTWSQAHLMHVDTRKKRSSQGPHNLLADLNGLALCQVILCVAKKPQPKAGYISGKAFACLCCWCVGLNAMLPWLGRSKNEVWLPVFVKLQTCPPSIAQSGRGWSLQPVSLSWDSSSTNGMTFPDAGVFSVAAILSVFHFLLCRF